MEQSLELHEHARSEPLARASLTRQVQDIQSRLDQLADAIAVTEASISANNPQPNPDALELRVRRILKLRSSRERIFGASLFGEPAWDMLLELYAAQLRGRSESVSSICLASGVPFTTALRWLKNLEAEGWVQRQGDPKDSRRFLLALTPKADAAMVRFFSQSEFASVL